MYTSSEIDALGENEIRRLAEEQSEMCDMISKIHSLGVLKLNNEFEYENANEAWFKINDVFSEKTLEKTKAFKWMENVTLVQHSDLQKQMKTLYAEKEFTIECEIISRTGEKHWVMIMANRINGGGKGYICVYIDITKRKELLPKLLEIKEMEWA